MTDLAAIRKRDEAYRGGFEADEWSRHHPETQCPADRDRRVLLAHIDALTAALNDIYNDARSPFTGVCRWCGAPPPDEDHDHDVACPAAKAGYALGKPGYRDWTRAAERLNEAERLAELLTIDDGPAYVDAVERVREARGE